MTDAVADHSRLSRLVNAPKPSPEAASSLLKRRYAAERRLKYAGLAALGVAFAMLGILLFSIVTQGYTAFFRTYIALDIRLDEAVIDPSGARDPEALMRVDYQSLVNDALYEAFPDVQGRQERRDLRGMLSIAAPIQVRDAVIADPSLIGTTHTFKLIAASNIDQVNKGRIDRNRPESERPVSDDVIALIDQLDDAGRLGTELNRSFLLTGDSRQPEMAGLYGSLIGSAYLMLITLVVSVPIGVASAIYLEEFAPKGRVTDFIEVNVNNLAAVPSIVFGLLGLAVFLQVFGLPRSSPLAGGLTLALMTLPTIVVATRAALRAVPPSIREGALGIGASKVQAISHHVLPLAMPGILTGTIIGLAQALGETAPLLMIGMNAFIIEVPQGPLDPAAALPVQVYIWADSPERQFAELTSGAIMVLLMFLIVMNATAVYFRKRFERKW